MMTYSWETKLVVALGRCFSAFQLLAVHLRVAATFKMLGHHSSVSKSIILPQGLLLMHLSNSLRGRFVATLDGLLQICRFCQHSWFPIPKVSQALPGFSLGWQEIQKSVANSHSLIAYVHTETHMRRESRKTKLYKRSYLSGSLFSSCRVWAQLGFLLGWGVPRGRRLMQSLLRAGGSEHDSSTEVAQCEEQSCTDLTPWENEALSEWFG